MVVRGAGAALAEAASPEAMAAAVAARAQVEGRYYLALKKPRDWDAVRARLIRVCSRPGFAEAARYSKPQGGSAVEGPSIRFVEAAIREMGNIYPDAAIVFEDERIRKIHVSVMDLESNVTWNRVIVLEKTVERSNPSGRRVLGERLNAQGRTVYLVGATEDELANKEAAVLSKVNRQLGLRIIPADIIDECMEIVVEVSKNRDAKDPDEARKRIVDGFGKIGVSVAELRSYIGGRPLAQITADEIQELRGVWAAIRDGGTTWAAALESKLAPAAPTAPTVQTARTVELCPNCGMVPPKHHPACTLGNPQPTPDKASDVHRQSPPAEGGAATFDEREVDRIVMRLTQDPASYEKERAAIEKLAREVLPGEEMSDYDYACEQYEIAKEKAKRR
jgi:hypothetical protein